MPQATLRTERLTLVPLADEHLEDEVALDAEPEVMRYLGEGVPNTREYVVEAHARRLARADEADGFGLWAGMLDGEFVGWWLLEPPDDTGATEIGYRLRSRFWRQGLASEGARELLRHAFEDLGVPRVFALTMAVNEGSRAVMASVGLTYVRTFHEDFPVPIAGSERGEVEYAITRSQWHARARS